MAKNKANDNGQPGREGVISIIGPGMRVVGDCHTEGTLRIEGTVEGGVRAGKAVVLGKDGVVEGDLSTQDAVIGGRVKGSVTAESRLELQATSVVEGTIRARRIKLEEGGTVNGMVQVGDVSHADPVSLDDADSLGDADSHPAVEASQPASEEHPAGERQLASEHHRPPEQDPGSDHRRVSEHRPVSGNHPISGDY